MEQLSTIQAPLDTRAGDDGHVAQAGVLIPPLFLASVSAGFPSPAEDYIDGGLDLNTHLIRNPASTFFVRAAGDSMVDAGIHSGDILVVDRSVEAKDGRVVIAVLDGDLTVKRLRQSSAGSISLHPENSEYSPIEIREGTSFEIWGVVTAVIHRL